MIRAQFTRFLKCARGLATVEAARILPVFATVSMAAADTGMLILNLHKIESGLAAGGSYLSRSVDLDADKPNAIRVAVTGYATEGHAATVDGWSTSDVTVTIQDVTNETTQSSLKLRGGDTVKIAHLQTSYTYSGLGFLNMVSINKIKLTASHEERLFGTPS